MIDLHLRVSFESSTASLEDIFVIENDMKGPSNGFKEEFRVTELRSKAWGRCYTIEVKIGSINTENTTGNGSSTKREK